MRPLNLPLQTLQRSLLAAWQQRTPRERQLLGVAAALLMAVMVWSLALAPALRTLHEASARQAALDVQTRQMQQLQAQAQALKAPTAITRAEAIRWLEANIPAGLGPDTQWRLQGERMAVTLSGTSPEQLATWLVQARTQAQALPVQAQLQQMPAANAPATATAKPSAQRDQPVRWSGTLLLSLP
jgi:general secretion pathway protein M